MVMWIGSTVAGGQVFDTVKCLVGKAETDPGDIDETIYKVVESLKYVEE